MSCTRGRASDPIYQIETREFDKRKHENVTKLTICPENMKRRWLKFDTWAEDVKLEVCLEIKRFSIRFDKRVLLVGHSQFTTYHLSLVYVREILKGDRFEKSSFTPRAKKRARRSQGIGGALSLEWGIRSLLEHICFRILRRERTRTLFPKARTCVIRCENQSYRLVVTIATELSNFETLSNFVNI